MGSGRPAFVENFLGHMEETAVMNEEGHSDKVATKSHGIS